MVNDNSNCQSSNNSNKDDCLGCKITALLSSVGISLYIAYHSKQNVYKYSGVRRLLYQSMCFGLCTGKL